MTPLPETSYSLLARLDELDNGQAWHQFLNTYQGALYRYARSRGLQNADAADVVQEVLLAVYQSIDRWQSPGDHRFRAWLFRTTFYLSTTKLRRHSRMAQGSGRSSVQRQLQELPDRLFASDQAEEDACQRWAFHWASAKVERQVEAATWQAFWLTAVENMPAKQAADRLAMTVGAVYAAKCRVLSRIREQARRLMSQFDRQKADEPPRQNRIRKHRGSKKEHGC